MPAFRYLGEPVPTERGTVDHDELITPPAVDATTGTGTGTPNVPYAGTLGGSAQYHRAPFGVALTLAPQDHANGAEVKQSGAGRAFIPNAVALPEQSVTPEPDRRRIARPMPTAAHDAGDVIGGRNG